MQIGAQPDVNGQTAKNSQPGLDLLPANPSEVTTNSTQQRPYAEPRQGLSTAYPSSNQQNRSVVLAGAPVYDKVNGDTNGRPHMSRAKSDFGPRASNQTDRVDGHAKGKKDEVSRIRHGWERQYLSPEYLKFLTSSFYMYYTDNKFESGGNPKTGKEVHELQDWRAKDRLKTVSAVLELCLNIGVDPPDVIKAHPCARLECWVDPINPNGGPGNTPMNLIGKALQAQYESLSMRTRYKLVMDPTVEETKKYCCTLRRGAKDERILFHYNGHGVPRPTSSGEIWVFNRNYTQYIPISLYDLQTWLGAPSIFVYDCSDAGLIVKNFHGFAKKHESEQLEARRKDPQAPMMSYGDCIHLAACREKEALPTNPDLPADVFTSCLTTPIEMAVRFFIMQNPIPSGVTLVDAANIPGKTSERRTPLGELNWIFTAITDTIAWNLLPKPLFKKLFRQDLMVAALFRNFLLAQRIMRVYHCHPQCYPEIPQTHDHPLWDSWDYAIEMVLLQLPDLIAAERGQIEYEYQHSKFFAEQLTAFEIYLRQGAVKQKIPEQLPIVLQVLLSQVHRLRALILLCKFLDFGPWAVNLALSIGIFPYVLKLLQSQAIELKPVMVFIWARILAVDGSPQTDLVKDSGYAYFISILDPTSEIPIGTIGNVSEHRAMCAFIVAMFCKGFRQAQTVCLSSELIECLLTHLLDLNNPLLRQWSCLCISMLWEGYAEAKWVGIKSSAHLRLGELALDNVPEVRTAMLHALTTFLGIPDVTPQVAQTEETIASMVLFMTTDGDSMVRKELLVFFSTFIARNKSKFVVAAYEQLKEERDNLRQQTTTNGEVKSGGSRQPTRARSESKNTIFAAIWTQVLLMSVDPHPEIARNASIVMDHVLIAILQSPLRMYAQEIMDEIMGCSKQTLRPLATPVDGTHTPYQTPSSPTTTTPTKQDGYFSAGMRRTASVAASFKNLASFGVSKLDSRTATQTSPPKSSTRPSRPERVPSPRSRIPTEWSRPPDEHDTHNYPQSYVQARVPTTRGFQPRDLSESPLVPLKSVFFEWSMEYFREPQMKPTEADEPGSYDYNRRLWRRNRNDRDIALTQPLKEKAGSGQWGHQEGLFDNKSTPMKMVFHQFEEHLVATDDRDSICVWDWRRKTLLSRFSAGNPPGSRLTELRLINEDEHALLMTGSSDGVIKIFRNYESQKNAELVSGFRALTDLVPSNKNAGLVFNWQQGQGKILVAGDERVIRVWSAGTEMCTSDIPARSGSCVTSLTSDQVEGHVFVAGFGDGAIRVYDQRERPQQAMVKVYREHRQWITNVHLQRGGMRELISGCRSGEVRLWDIRMDRSVGRVKTVGEKKNTLRTLSVHEHAPVFAIGSERHKVEVFNTNGIHLTTCEPYTSFLQQTPLSPRLPPISATAFHPHRMLLACAALNDNNINFYRCHSRRRVDIYDG